MCGKALLFRPANYRFRGYAAAPNVSGIENNTGILFDFGYT